MKFLVTLVLITQIFWEYCDCNEYYAALTQNGPVVLGATISFNVEVSYADGERSTDNLRFLWKDDAIPHHEGETKSDNGESHWNVTYPTSLGYAPGQYEVQVTVQKWIFVSYFTVTSQRIKFDLTAKLNGNLKISQGGMSRKGPFVSNKEEVLHEVALSTPDLEFLSNATQVLSFWYVDCVYYGYSEGYKFLFNYTEEEQARIVEVLVMASFEPLPTPEPSTTTTTTAAPTTSTAAPSDNSSTTMSTSSTSTTTTASTSATTSTTVSPPTTASSSEEKSGLMRRPTLIKDSMEFVPHICMNSSIIPPDRKKLYGYFSKKIEVKAPVDNVVVNGTNWLKHGDLLNLQIGCQGSFPYSYCFQIYSGLYNATGNETCRADDTVTRSVCDFSFQHYFPIAKTYTVLIIIINDVTNKVIPVAVNIYEVTKKAQLSVIVVPVVCTILAVVLIIFGVAYYVQNRRRFVVEVADFHFGHTDVDMECKTFKERLREAIMNAFSRSVIEDDSDSESSDSDKRTGRMWPRRGVGNAAGPSTSGSAGVSGNLGGGRSDARGQKYGSME